MATPEPPHRPFTFSRFLVLVAFGVAIIALALLFANPHAISLVTAVALLFVVLAVYLASLLVP